MRNLPLNQSRVDRLKPRNSAYDIRDTDLKGFGIRTLPSGKKSYFLQAQHEGQRRWTKIGDADAMSEAEARLQARSLLAGIRKGRESIPDLPADIAFEAVADEVFSYYRRHWKPRTLAVNLNYYQNNILPWFKGRPVAGITRPEVLEWFESLHAKPASANRSLPVLSVILRQAEVYGYRPEDSNPCKDIKRYRRRARERFLSPDEILRVVEVLNRYDGTRPLQAAVIRLLLLTGCRKSELLTLKWRDYREGKLFLRDSKNGPRTVWLSSAAREVLDRLPRKSAWVFPSHWRNLDHLSGITDFWQDVRTEAGLRDVRPHDLRHTYASIALMHGETVLTIGRLLGHDHPGTTLKYTNFADAAAREAVDTVSSVLRRA